MIAAAKVLAHLQRVLVNFCGICAEQVASVWELFPDASPRSTPTAAVFYLNQLRMRSVLYRADHLATHTLKHSLLALDHRSRLSS